MLTTEGSGNPLLTKLFRNEGISLCECVWGGERKENGMEWGGGKGSTFILKRKNANFVFRWRPRLSLSPSSDFNEDIFLAAAPMSNVIFWLKTSTFRVGGFSRLKSW